MNKDHTIALTSVIKETTIGIRKRELGINVFHLHISPKYL